MKSHVLIITAYKDIEALNTLIESTVNYFDIFIHIDKKSKIDPKKISHQCNIYSIYKVNWGSLEHLRAILFLINEASKKKYEYFHIISGQDYPASHPEQIIKQCNGSIFMHYKKSNRNTYFNLFHFLDAKGFLFKILTKFSISAQKKLGFTRRKLGPYSKDAIYQGLVWSSLPRYAIDFVMKQNISELTKSMKTIFIPEEILFQTILANSEFKSKIKFHKRYTIWEEKNNARPGILDIDDMPIFNKGYFFARKIDSIISKELISAITKK